MATNIPKKIKCKDQVFSIDFHPSQPYLAAGLVDGSIELWQYGNNANIRQLSQCLHPNYGCRGLTFLPHGDQLLSISSDKSWKLLDSSGQVIQSLSNAHDHAINSLSVLDDNHSFVTGDDNGIIKLWDLRSKPSPTTARDTWDVHTDYISALLFQAEQQNTLLSSSGDATLAVYDLRQHDHFYKSDDQESEILCLEVMRNGKKVIGGTQEGVSLFFDWGDWGDCSDRFPGHPDSINTFYKIDESTLLTGSADGYIRVVSVLPNKMLGIVGQLRDHSIETIRAAPDQPFIATLSLDETIRFWDISILQDDSDEDDVEGEEEDQAQEEEGNDDDEDDDDDASGRGEEDDEDVSSDQSDDESAAEDKKEVEEDEDSDDNDSDSDHSDDKDSDKDSDSDSSESSEDKPAQKKRRLPTAREKFYADL